MKKKKEEGFRSLRIIKFDVWGSNDLMYNCEKNNFK